MKPRRSKTSGFAAGRSQSSGSPRIAKKSDKPLTQREEKLSKLKRAKSDLAEVLGSFDDNPDPPIGDAGNIDKVVSRFTQSFKKIRRDVTKDGDDLNADVANRALLRTLFAMNLDLIPIAEDAFRGSKKEQAAYALLAIQKQAQEIAAELKMLGNVAHQSSTISEKITHPTFRNVGQILLRLIINYKNTLDTEIEDNKTASVLKRKMDEMAKELAIFIDRTQIQIDEQIHGFLAGDLDFTTPTPKPAPVKKRKKRE